MKAWNPDRGATRELPGSSFETMLWVSRALESPDQVNRAYFQYLCGQLLPSTFMPLCGPVGWLGGSCLEGLWVELGHVRGICPCIWVRPLAWDGAVFGKKGSWLYFLDLREVGHSKLELGVQCHVLLKNTTEQFRCGRRLGVPRGQGLPGVDPASLWCQSLCLEGLRAAGPSGHMASSEVS